MKTLKALMQNFTKNQFLIYVVGLLTILLLLRGASDAKSHVLIMLSLAYFVVFPGLLKIASFTRPRLTTIYLGTAVAGTTSAWLLSTTPNVGLNEVFAMSFALVVCIAAATWFQDPKNQEKYTKAIVAVAGITTIIGFAVYLFAPFNRFTGLFVNLGTFTGFYPNAWVSFLIVVLPFITLALCRSLKQKHTKKSILLGAVLALNLASFILTYSRGGWIAFTIATIIGTGAAVAYNYKSITKVTSRRYIVAIILVVFTSIGAITGANYYRTITGKLTNSFVSKATFTADEQLDSAVERGQLFTGAIQLFKERPLVGYGPQSFRYLFTQKQQEFLAYAEHPHNWYLKIAAEQGILGLLPLLSFLFVTLGVGIYKLRVLPLKEKNTLIAAGTANLGLLGHQMIEYSTGFLVLWLLLWVNFGLIHAATKAQEVSPKTNKATQWLLAGVIGIGFLVAMREGYYGLALKKARTTNNPQDFAQAQHLLRPNDTTVLHLTALIDANPQAANTLAVQQQANHQFDAEFYFLWGQALKAAGDQEQATQKLARALELNPLNHFHYYVEWYSTISSAEKSSHEQELTILLEGYLEQLARNAHFTLLTENPDAAASLAELINQPQLAEFIRKTTQTGKQKLQEEYNLN